MCEKHFQSRPLTTGERQIAQTMFGDSLQLDGIRLKTAWWVLKGYAVSPNGNVYFHKADFQEDFSKADLGTRAWLVHELTHVWQVQHGVAVLRKALFNRKYRYQLQADKPFDHYGVEQQACMVADLYQQRECGQPNQQLVAIVPFGKPGTPSRDNDTYVV